MVCVCVCVGGGGYPVEGLLWCVCVWGGGVYRGTVNAQMYCDEVMKVIVRPYSGAVGERFILMHNNARSHPAQICVAYLDQQSIEVMYWSSKTTALTPIEPL